MKAERLLTNMRDQILEAQLKLSYAKEIIRLYYPVSSLNALLGLEVSEPEDMKEILEQAKELQGTKLGQLQFAIHGGRLEIGIPPEGVEYVYQNHKATPFLKELIELFQNKHACSIEEICQVFAAYSDDYSCQAMPAGTDFDYCVRFLDSSIDEYYYCIKMEMGHTIYHRFMQEDFQQLFL